MERRKIEVVDSTILGTLDECPRKCQYAFQMGKRTKGEHRALDFGKAYHAGTAAWYKSGKNDEEMLAAFNAEYSIYAADAESQGEDGEDSKEVRTYSKGHELLLARARQFRNEEWEWLGGEQQFVLDLPGCPLQYAGFVDGFGSELGGTHQYVIQEEKTSTSPWIFCPNPNAQITGYVYAARTLFNQDIRRAYLTMAGIYKSSVEGRVKGKKKADPLREVVNREIVDLNLWDLSEWQAEVIRKSERLLWYQDNWPWWEKQTRSCGNYGGCAFQPICQAPPNMREEFLDAGFEENFWSPIDERR